MTQKKAKLRGEPTKGFITNTMVRRLRMLAQGMTYKEIADKENVSVRGVNDCIYRAKAITGARTIIQLVVKVLYSGEEW